MLSFFSLWPNILPSVLNLFNCLTLNYRRCNDELMKKEYETFDIKMRITKKVGQINQN